MRKRNNRISKLTCTYSKLGSNGRLGNQLWQIASTIGLAERLSAKVALPPNWSLRPYFRIPSHYFADLPLIHPSIVDLSPNFLQESQLIENVTARIRSFFSPSSAGKELLRELFPTLCKYNRAVTAVHVRRSDYLKFPNHFPELSVEGYYRPAMRRFKGSCFVVFSDDVPWCEAAFSKLSKEFTVKFETQLLERTRKELAPEIISLAAFFAMTHCKNLIMANSTFSWWAAFLKKGHGTCIYPRAWFGAGFQYARCPSQPQWVRI